MNVNYAKASDCAERLLVLRTARDVYRVGSGLIKSEPLLLS